MAKKNRPTLKTYFEAGDIPTEGNYVDFIDSTLNISELNIGDISISGSINITGSNGHLTHITSSGNISASRSGSDGGIITAYAYGANVSGSITSTGSFGRIEGTRIDATHFSGEGREITNVTASAFQGTLELSGSMYSGSMGGIVTGSSLIALSVTGSIIPQGDNQWDLGSPSSSFNNLYVDNIGEINNIQAITISAPNIFASETLYSGGSITASADISCSGHISASSIYADEIYTSGSTLYIGNQPFKQTHLEDLKAGKSIRDTSALTAKTYTIDDGRVVDRKYEHRFNRWAPNINFESGDSVEYSETDHIPQSFVDLTDKFYQVKLFGGRSVYKQELYKITLDSDYGTANEINIEAPFVKISTQHNGKNSQVIISGSISASGDITSSGMVKCAGLELTKIGKGGIGSYGSTINAGAGRSFTFTLVDIPTIAGKSGDVEKFFKSAPTLIQNSTVESDSVVIVNCTTDLLSCEVAGQKVASNAGTNGFYLSLGNEHTSAFTIQSASFSAIVF